MSEPKAKGILVLAKGGMCWPFESLISWRKIRMILCVCTAPRTPTARSPGFRPFALAKHPVGAASKARQSARCVGPPKYLPMLGNELVSLSQAIGLMQRTR